MLSAKSYVNDPMEQAPSEAKMSERVHDITCVTEEVLKYAYEIHEKLFGSNSFPGTNPNDAPLVCMEDELRVISGNLVELRNVLGETKIKL